jgi:hypothetical protein
MVLRVIRKSWWKMTNGGWLKVLEVLLFVECRQVSQRSSVPKLHYGENQNRILRPWTFEFLEVHSLVSSKLNLGGKTGPRRQEERGLRRT